MKRIYITLMAVLTMGLSASAQFLFDPSVNSNFTAKTVVMPPSPLYTQILFVGGVDMVQTLGSDGKPNGQAVAKQWHDFIGFTEDKASNDLGWVVVNHEMIAADDKIGDGGGMTAFKVKRDPKNDTLIIVEQTLNDGRKGFFFNVDFANTVGETGMNCGGIVSDVDGRIWTAEEWFRTSNSSVFEGGNGVRDTQNWTISTTIEGDFNGKSIKKYQNFNYMVEIDPKQAKAIRKQYNWGRQGFEGGCVMPDNKTVYLGVDNTPAFFLRFIATTAGDFTKGTLQYYAHNKSPKWRTLDNKKLDVILNMDNLMTMGGGSMFNRVEWVTYNQTNGKVYFTETGRDNPGSAWAGEYGVGAAFAAHHSFRALQQGTTPENSAYTDYYGRVMEYDPTTQAMRVYLEGGPEFKTKDVPANQYPKIHLSNPDGLSIMYVNGKTFLLVQEDLNGSSYGRVPAGVSNRSCELFLLDMSIENPTVNDLVRIAVVPEGAEITGARATNDGKTILINSQHPSGSNPYPYNNSLTFAITGWDKAVEDIKSSVNNVDATSDVFTIYPNPTTRELHFNKVTDVAIFDAKGTKVKVVRNSDYVDVSDLTPGVYYVQNLDGETQKLVIK